MNITLIAPIMFDLGICTIAPQLRAKGHKVKLLFIPELMQDCLTPHALSKKVVSSICGFLESSDLIGTNCLSEDYLKTAAFVDSVKTAVNKPIVWGGIHATLRPQDCIKHADIVCVGEGEEAIVELAYKMETNEKIDNIKNLISKSNNKAITNIQLRSPVDLNSLLPLDYDLEFQYVTEGTNIRNVEERDFNGCFLSYSSRGCPFRCSYCCNATILKKVYKEKIYCRQRNIDNIIKELKEIKSRFSSCKTIWFNEADFLYGKDQSMIEDFSKKYKLEIDIPFYIWTNPSSIREEAVSNLVTAGCKGTSIGTISANREIQKGIYNRSATPQLYRKATKILKKYGMSVEYDFILCNPYESNKNIIDNINLIRSFPKPFQIVIYSLTYFPETDLFRRVVKDGIVKEGDQVGSYTKAAYKSWFFTGNTAYLNAVASMMRGNARKTSFLGMDFYGLLPDPILRVLISKTLVRLFSLKPFRLLVFPIIGISIKVAYTTLVRVINFCKRLFRKITNEFR